MVCVNASKRISRMAVPFVILSALILVESAVSQNAVTRKELRSANISVRRCSPVIANLKTGEYSVAPRRKFVCLRSKKDAEEFFVRSDDATGAANDDFATESSFSLSGQGQSNTPAFRVENRPARLDYSYDGDGRFSITLRRRSDGRNVEKLVDRRGPMTGFTYILTSDTLFLEIDGDIDDGLGSWDVDLTDAAE